MRKIIWLFIILIMSLMRLFAQNTDESFWKTYVGNQEEFIVNAPVGFSLVDYNPEVENSLKGYRGKINGQTYAVWTSQDKQKSYFSIFSKFIQDNKSEGVAELIDSFKSKVYNFTDSEGISHKIAFVETDSRFFIFHTFGGSANTKDFANFFNSIKIKKSFSQSENLITSLSTDNKTENNQTTDKNIEKSRGQGAGSGSGEGSGIGSGQGSGKGGEKNNENTQPEKNLPVVVPMQILTKPRANYTDMARIYGIQGAVSLRVTFLADGTIGSVSPVSGLPLGLTKSSIEAAKNLTFKPALKDGVPQTVVRTIQYSFTLY